MYPAIIAFRDYESWSEPVSVGSHLKAVRHRGRQARRRVSESDGFIGFIRVMGRIDDAINVAGHRLSTGAIEEVLSEDADIAECVVVGAADTLKGQLSVALVVLKAGRAVDQAAIEGHLVREVRDRIGPIGAFRRVVIVSRLPKTRSGKILRGVLRAIADQRPFTVPPTIEDAPILDEIEALFS